MVSNDIDCVLRVELGPALCLLNDRFEILHMSTLLVKAQTKQRREESDNPYSYIQRMESIV